MILKRTPTWLQFILPFSRAKQRGEDVHHVKSLFFVRRGSSNKEGAEGGKKKENRHQRRSFETVNCVPITKATCYALRLNHNKGAMEGHDPRASKWMLSALE